MDRQITAGKKVCVPFIRGQSLDGSSRAASGAVAGLGDDGAGEAAGGDRILQFDRRVGFERVDAISVFGARVLAVARRLFFLFLAVTK